MPLLHLPAVLHPALVGRRVAAAVSGGADSVALTLWLHNFATRPRAEVVFAGIIHVNHHLRGGESDADAAFCRELAQQLNVPIDVVDAPVMAGGGSPEAHARRLRYAAFTSAAARLNAAVVCTAHTADDQAETVLLRLLRGAGLRGVSGIREVHERFVRPLLGSRRDRLRDALRQAGASWREDASNADLAIPRNRVRHELLPHLERVAAEIAPGGVEALARFAACAADDEQFLEAAATELAALIVKEVDAGRSVTRDALNDAPPALARRVVRMAAEAVAPDREWATSHIEAVRALARRHEGGGSLDLPGVLVRRGSNEMRFEKPSGLPARPTE